ncbi:hypothetical protein A2U01_0102555, partial [Trifolium medium]|nr:hypothetical protein [Trifolium medium]
MSEIVYPPPAEHLLPGAPLTLLETLNAGGVISPVCFPENYSPPRAAAGPPPTEVPENDSPPPAAATPPVNIPEN